MNKKIRVSAVSYLNSKPLIYGLQHTDIANQIELTLDMPADCANNLLNDKVDIGLVPVAVLPSLKEYYILSDYCIGAVGKVNSVNLYSDVPLEEIKSVYLDYQSKTSVTLVRVLAENFWKINPAWIKAKEGFERNIGADAAGVIIGDRTFGITGRYKYVYDLAEEWMKFTSLPFVFAGWVANKKLPLEFLKLFSQAIDFGIKNKEKAIQEWTDKNQFSVNVREYLEKYISYPLDDQKREGLKKFLSYL